LVEWVRVKLALNFALMRPGLIICVLLFVLPRFSSKAAEPSAPSTDSEFFEKQIRPVLVERCHKCHSSEAEKLKGGLLLDSREALLKGGDSGSAIELGHPEKSRLITALQYQDVDLQMPPKGKLSDSQIADFIKWIKIGAPWTEHVSAQAAKKEKKFDLEQRKKDHWAWREIESRNPPEIADRATNPIDRFVFAKLEAAGVKHAAPADKRSLIRRASFDLTGLPPTPDEVAALLKDSSADAFEKVVDRLLDSPRFGERWARHWLDLARYAETYGHEFDYPILGAWHYRDYVIRAFNSNLPYDQFLTEQMAGDLITKPRWLNGTNESLIGTIFWSLGQQVHSPVDAQVHTNDRIDNEIDVATKTFLGLTVACARCHDHKFDAIATKDYYSMFSVLASSRYAQRSIVQPLPDKVGELTRIKDELRQALAAEWSAELEKMTDADLGKIDFGNLGAVPDTRQSPPFASATDDGFASWLADGEAWESALVKPGELLIRPHARVQVAGQRVMDSGLVSARLQGELRSRDFTIPNKYIYVRCAGHGTRINVVVSGFTLIRDPIYGALRHVINQDDLTWERFDVAMWQGRTAYIELADIEPGDRSDDGHASYGNDGWLVVENVTFSDVAQPPAMLTLTVPSRAQMKAVIEKWAAGDAGTEAPLLAAFVRGAKLHNPKSPEALKLLQRQEELEKSFPAPVYIASITDGPGLDEHVFIRGNYKSPGDLAPRAFLTALKCPDEKIARGSGRLEIAQEMLATPFAARVRVNWIWHHLFGRGIVASIDNFGVLGEKPSNPELLDWLANDFRTNGWNIKKTISLIMNSQAYQMASVPTDELSEQQDSSNLLLHRANVRRLEGEAIRDSILAVSGALNTNMFGKPVPIHLTPFMDGRGRPGQSGPLDGDGRRTIYVEVRRNFVSPMMLAFDAPTPLSTVGRRTVSNVPAQALIMLNDPFVLQQAQAWADRMMTRSSVDDRIETMYELAFARPPRSEELEDAKNFLAEQSASYGLKPEQLLANREVWTDLCHVLFNVKEFIFVN
jgi:hypothetical protein